MSFRSLDLSSSIHLSGTAFLASAHDGHCLTITRLISMDIRISTWQINQTPKTRQDGYHTQTPFQLLANRNRYRHRNRYRGRYGATVSILWPSPDKQANPPNSATRQEAGKKAFIQGHHLAMTNDRVNIDVLHPIAR